MKSVDTPKDNCDRDWRADLRKRVCRNSSEIGNAFRARVHSGGSYAVARLHCGGAGS